MWKKVISLVLVLFILSTLVSCGGITTPDDDESGQHNDSSQDLILIKNINPENNVVGTVTENTFVKNKEIGADIIAILGEKDSFGNAENLTGAIYILEEDALEVIANDKGLAISVKDLQGDVIVFENYTNCTVDISIFDSNGNLILDPTILEIDPYELEEVQKYYLSDEEIDKFKWAAKIFGYTACTESVVADIYTLGALTPLVLKICGSAFSSPYQFIACVGTITEVIAEVSENPNQPPTINSLSAESTYIKPTETVEITCYVDDPDETENFSFSWSSPDGGDFIAMPYIYQPNLPSWESNVPWKCSSTIIWTAPDSTGIYVINCTVIDKEGETASDSIRQKPIARLVQKHIMRFVIWKI
jgi:hypothetical protein